MSLVQINARPEFVAEDGRWKLLGRGEPLIVESIEQPVGEPPEQVAVSYTMPDGTKRRGNAAQFGETSFRYELPPLAEPVDLYITGGDDWLGPITIEPIDRPADPRAGARLSAAPAPSRTKPSRSAMPARSSCTCPRRS